MRQTTHCTRFIAPLLLLVALLVPQGAWASTDYDAGYGSTSTTYSAEGITFKISTLRIYNYQGNNSHFASGATFTISAGGKTHAFNIKTLCGESEKSNFCYVGEGTEDPYKGSGSFKKVTYEQTVDGIPVKAYLSNQKNEQSVTGDGNGGGSKKWCTADLTIEIGVQTSASIVVRGDWRDYSDGVNYYEMIRWDFNIPAHTHVYTADYVSNNDATCLANGTKSRYCSYCNYNDKVTVTGSALGHVMTTHPAVTETCTTSGNVVYYTCSRTCCEGKIYKDGSTTTNSTYTNLDATVKKALDHNFDSNGVCTRDPSHYQPATLSGGYYQIANYGNLCWFRDYARTTDAKAKAKLTVDIDLSGKAWATSIGEGTAFGGEFDGQGHVITGNARKALFCVLAAGSTVKNLVAASSTSKDNYENAAYQSPFVRRNYGTIENCIVRSAYWDSRSSYVGGITGVNEDGGIVRNCGFHDSTLRLRNSANTQVGGIVGVNCSGGLVENCFTWRINYYNIGSLGSAGIVCENRAGGTVRNCYTNNGTSVFKQEGTATGMTAGIDATFITSGEMGYKLNGGVTNGTQVWYQNIGTESFPTPAVKNTAYTIYQIAGLKCDHSTKNGSFIYANNKDAAPTVEGHGLAGYTPSYSWSGEHDKPVCTFSLECIQCNTTVTSGEINTSVVQERLKPATCHSVGNVTYLAAGSYSQTGDVTYRDSGVTHDYEIPMTTHNFAANDPEHTFCTICTHTFFRYTSRDGSVIDPNNRDAFLAANDTVIHYTNTYANGKGVMEFNGPVTTIGDGAFMYCELSGDLTIPVCVKTISSNAFSECTELSGTLVIPDSVKVIGNDAFSLCRSLKTLVLGNSVERIEQRAFFGCTRLNNAASDGDLVIPESVKSIGEAAFMNCSGFTGQLILPDNGALDSIYSNAFHSTQFSGTLHIPSTVTSLGATAFRGCNKFTSLDLQANITNLDNFVFAECANLSGDVHLPEGLTTIGDGVFSHTNVNTIYLPQTLTEINSFAFYLSNITSIHCSNPAPPKSNHELYVGDAPYRVFVSCTAYDDYKQAKAFTSAQEIVPMHQYDKDDVCSFGHTRADFPSHYYLALTAEQDYVRVVFTHYSDGNLSSDESSSSGDLPDFDGEPIPLQISYDGYDWTPVDIRPREQCYVDVYGKGNRVYVRARNEIDRLLEEGSTSRYLNISASWDGKVSVTGNVMSLLSPVCANKPLPPYAFYKLFSGANITTAPILPATQLGEQCYAHMFEGCCSLTQAPELPADTLAPYCYADMFLHCDNLVKIPQILHAQQLAKGCYRSMFEYCTSLEYAPELPARQLAQDCYYSMFRDCHSLTQAPELPADTLAQNCYEAMFQNCTSLVYSPELPARNLAPYCYYSMFKDCFSLYEIPELPALTVPSHAYDQMFYDCGKIHITDSPIAAQKYTFPNFQYEDKESFPGWQMFEYCGENPPAYIEPGMTIYLIHYKQTLDIDKNGRNTISDVTAMVQNKLDNEEVELDQKMFTRVISQILGRPTYYLIPDTFSVSPTTKVQFAPANLWTRDYTTLHIEEFPTGISLNLNFGGHLSFFMQEADNDELLTSEDLPVEEMEGIEGLRVPTVSELEYLMFDRPNSKNLCLFDCYVEDCNGVVIAPDNFSGTLKDVYTLEELRNQNLVFIPSIGCLDRGDMTVYEYGDCFLFAKQDSKRAVYLDLRRGYEAGNGVNWATPLGVLLGVPGERVYGAPVRLVRTIGADGKMK